MIISFDYQEIRDAIHFEELVTAYFENLRDEEPNNIVDIKVYPSGIGTDGGRDILVTLKVADGIETFMRRWIIQCKFHKKNISTDEIADINIPTLIYSYKASGYLLICRKKPTSKLTDFFERLENNCIFGYKYLVWSGEQFKMRLLPKKNILQQFFPNYYSSLTNKN